MIYSGLQVTSDNEELNYLVCHVQLHRKRVAVIDLNVVMNNINASKPKVMSFEQVIKDQAKAGVCSKQYDYPAELSFSDTELKRQKRTAWLKKRDVKYSRIEPLTSEHFIEQYLYGDGLASEIQTLKIENILSDPDKAWKTPGAYYNALNRYIVFGCTSNALLPFKLKACGSNYRHIEKPGDDNVKRGRGGANNDKSRSKSCGITNRHKKFLSEVVAFCKNYYDKFSYSKAKDIFRLNFECHRIEREVEGNVTYSYIPYPDHECLSDAQINYHLKKILNKTEYLKLKYGNLAYEKDHADRQGDAHDGVIGATHRYEVDATILDVYVRYPYDTSGQYTMGRPVLYLVIDVFSTMIVGMYLGFDGPNWQGASQALVNACMDKSEYCARYGLSPEEINWPAAHIPVQITVDNGTEHTNGVIRSVLRQEIGIRAYNFTAAFRGDAKGIVERAFGVLNDEVIHFLPGSIMKAPDRGEQHQSNQAEYDSDALIKRIILEIQFHNNSADRISRMNINAFRANISITPQALFLHSIDQEMNGGRPSKYVDPGRIRWAFLPEETASVRANGIYFKGLIYHSDYAKKAGWYTKAKHHGAFKIAIKRSRDWSSELWHKTPEGEYICLHLKNTNNESLFLDQHWEPLLHVLEQFKDKQHSNTLNRKKLLAHKQRLIDQIEEHNKAAIAGAPENTRKSIQPGIKGRQNTIRAIQKLVHAIEMHDQMMQESTPEPPHRRQLDDLDNEMNL
ncbi:hypothetical protein [Amphritea sp.]|uniref:hypothetical protein n=1 Tax=Amphritea sp. TaxID=1872502 RepID=UPI003A91267E